MKSSPEIQLAQDLIRMPSTPGSGGEAVVAQFLADRLETAGFRTVVHNYGDGEHSNVVARWGRDDQPAVCLSGHLDTVTVVEEHWQFDPYAADIVGSRLLGRGSVDMKAGVAAMVHAVEAYVASAAPDATPVTVLLTAEEEVGSLGAAALAREPGLLAPSRLLLVAEPTSNQPAVGHRGALWLDLVASGRSCHGSTPQLGENAIERLMDGLMLVRDWCARHATGHEVLGGRTLNIGRLNGGVLRNIVPDCAVAELDIRTPSEEEQSTLVDTLTTLMGDLARVEPIVSLPPVYTSPTDPTFRLVQAVARARVAVTDPPTVARFFTPAC